MSDDPRHDDAWSALEARWADEEAHRAYLAAQPDLDGLAEAGRRYRAALERNPGDGVAARWRDEVVKRATVLALAQLPRTKPPRASSRRARLLVLAVLLLGFAAGVGLVLARSPGLPVAGSVP